MTTRIQFFYLEQKLCEGRFASLFPNLTPKKITLQPEIGHLRTVPSVDGSGLTDGLSRRKLITFWSFNFCPELKGFLHPDFEDFHEVTTGLFISSGRWIPHRFTNFPYYSSRTIKAKFDPTSLRGDSISCFVLTHLIASCCSDIEVENIDSTLERMNLRSETALRVCKDPYWKRHRKIEFSS